MSYRKEKKFRLSYSDLKKIKSYLKTLGLKQLHPPRVIYSKYFDTPNLSMFSDSEEGLLPRKKIRLRWYKNNLSLNLETKISASEGRFKISKEIIEKENNQKYESISDPMYGIIYPTILVIYRREYYLFKKLRLTFDTKINYTDLRRNSKKTYRDFETVMEVKSSFETNDDYIEKIIPHTTSRFSKYSRGVLLSNGLL